MAVGLSGDSYSTLSTSTEIPAGIFTNAFIRFSNVDSSSTEFTYITVPTNQERDLVFQNVKIRK